MSEEMLSELWAKYEKAWGFRVPPETRRRYEQRCRVCDTATFEDLKGDLEGMTEMVIVAYSRGRSAKGSPGHRGTYINPFIKRINRAAWITEALIDTGQDGRERKNWKLVAEKLRDAEPDVTPEQLRKDYHHAMSDTAVASAVNACVRAVRAEATMPEMVLDLYRQVAGLIGDGREEKAYVLLHEVLLPAIREMPKSAHPPKCGKEIEEYLELEAELARAKEAKRHES